jgi:hypothetical protein
MSFTDHFKAKIGADTAQLEQSVNKANQKVKQFSTGIKSMFGQFLAVGAVTTFVSKLTQMTSGLQDTSNKLGVSTDFLQKFRYATEQSGVKLQEAEMGLQRFLRRAGTANQNGGDQLKKVFDDLGVSLKTTNGTVKSGEQLFMDFADAIGKVKDPNDKLATAFKLLDSEGVNMLKMIKDGGDEFRKLGKEAEDLGLVLDTKTIKSVKDTEAELRKAKSEFNAIASQVLPAVLKAINLAINGWKGLHGACKLLNVELQLFAQTVAKEITDAFTKFDAHLDKIKAKANAFVVKINPFSTDEDVRKAEQRVDRYAKYAEKVDKKTSNTFAQNRQQILNADKKLMDERKSAINQIQSAQRKSKQIIDGNADAEKKHNNILRDANTILDEAKTKRTEINQKITEALDRIKALKNGGETELAVTIRRQKAEKEIIKLMKSGKMSREEATKVVNQILQLEQQEKQLMADIKDEAQRIKDIEDARKNRQAIIQGLIQEKQLHLDIQQIDKAIDIARQAGLKNEVEILRQKRMQLQVQGLNVAEADKEIARLKQQLQIIDQKRNAMNMNLQILDLQAQGRDKEAKQLQANLDIENKIKQVAMDLKITLREARDIVKKEVELNKEIKQLKIDEEIKQKQLNKIREDAQKKVQDGLNQEEKQRIRLAKKIEQAEQKIMSMKDRQDAKAKQAVAYWEKVKDRNLRLYLDDATTQDLDELQNQRTALGDQFDIHKKALDNAMQMIQQEEAQAHANNVAEEAQLKMLKQQILQEEQGMIKENNKKIGEVGDKAKKGVENAGDAVVKKIKDVDLNLKNNNNQIVAQLTILANAVADIAPAIRAIKFPAFPSYPTPPPTIVKVDIDTSKLSTEYTQEKVLNKLSGFFVNQ